MAEPWGHKITISIYVAGTDKARVVRAAEVAAEESERAVGCWFSRGADFVGVSVSPAAEQPYDQGAHQCTAWEGEGERNGRS